MSFQHQSNKTDLIRNSAANTAPVPGVLSRMHRWWKTFDRIADKQNKEIRARRERLSDNPFYMR